MGLGLAIFVFCNINPVVAQKEGLTLDFKDADIRSVLRILAEKGNINIVYGPEVTGMVTMKLKNVTWEKALDVILKTYGYGYEKENNIIRIMTLEKLTEEKTAKKELEKVEPVLTKVFVLKYLDASDAKKVVDTFLTDRGKASVVEMTGIRGWEFEVEAKLKREEEGEEKVDVRSKTLVVTDIESSLNRITQILSEIDVMPKQIIIESKIVEVSKDKLDDIGFDWGTGYNGTQPSNVNLVTIKKTKEEETSEQRNSMVAGAHSLTWPINPSVFGPKSSGLDMTNTGLQFVFRKLTGTEFEFMLHALQEDVEINILSNPKVLTVDNQEATIMVGTKYPILSTSVSGTDTTTTYSSLDHYADIGIQLNVVPQIVGDKFINMIIHPAVSSFTETLKARSSTGQITAEYPIINIREAETQVVMKSGETVVIGGLLKDVKSTGEFSVPILGDIPLLGALFKRQTTDTEKIELLIFITATIVGNSNQS